MQWLKKHGLTVIIVAVGLTGVLLMAYPIVSDWWNSFRQSRVVASYVTKVKSLNQNQYNELIESAGNYNGALAQSGILWTMDEAQEDEYNAELNIDDSGVMGFITIPKIDVMLPIYHDTDESLLQVAIGHLAGTSLPVGGESSHCVLFGHRGLPSARLFTDLDKLTEGDTFTLTVLDQTFTYEVDQIRVVEPEDLRELKLEKGKDYCTLVTCTPYGINTHRLLVRGQRLENMRGEVKVVAEALQVKPVYIIPFIAIPIVVILLLVRLIGGSNKNAPAMKKKRPVVREKGGRHVRKKK